MSYQKFPAEDPSKFDLEDISKNLRNLDKQLKLYQKDPGNVGLSKEIERIQGYLTEIFKRPRAGKETKSKLHQLESNFKDLNMKFRQREHENTYEVQTEENLEDFGINERSSLAYNNSVEIQKKELEERKENIENLHKDFIVVNSLFKDTAMMVGEQGKMLEEADKNITVAVAETNKGVNELHKADKYQQSAKKKLGCIFIIAFIVVGVLIAIILGVVVF